MRNNNIKYGNQANEKIVGYLKGLGGFQRIREIRDRQQNSSNLQGMEKLENDVNIHLGIDYVLEINNKTHYIDTKGFKYNPKYYGSLEDGKVETMLLQVEKRYGGNLYNGWANNPKHLTDYILILINNRIYYMDYKKLVPYCKTFNKGNVAYEYFDKGYGNYEICIKAPVKEMVESGVIACIEKIN